MFDKKYKEILQHNLKIKDPALLDCIVGEEEFRYFLSKYDKNSFVPLKNFCANLHVHTIYSDGTANIKEIFDNAQMIAEKNNKQFLLAITDHDTIEGTKEALTFLLENKEKYKNLKLVLGVEISTVGTKFSGQIKAFDIHTLVYCINPFDKRLNDFINKKRQLKFELAKRILSDLQNGLENVLKTYNIELSLDEASKIHPMITKGEDEVSHPLKKYIFSKILFSHYVENDDAILNILKTKGIDTKSMSYEMPVFKYKSMFNNEKYFYIYKEALEKYLNQIIGENIIKLPQIPQSIVETLLKGKYICEAAHPSVGKSCTGQDAFSFFEDTLSFISSLDYGLMSIAHPARLNLKNTTLEYPDFFDELFYTYKKYGRDKAYAYEKYYQSYSNKKIQGILDIIDNSADKFALAFTGGIDSHGKNICTRC